MILPRVEAFSANICVKEGKLRIRIVDRKADAEYFSDIPYTAAELASSSSGKWSGSSFMSA